MQHQQVRDDTYALAGPNGRLPGTIDHQQAARFIEDRFGSLGLDPFHGETYQLPYAAAITPAGRRAAGGQPMLNLAAVIPGRDRTLPPIIIGAHYDSVIAAPSADDNASSVAAMLAAAEQLLAGGRLRRDVVLAAFDGEEPPFFHSTDMGSTRFVGDHFADRPVHVAIVMDLIGHPVDLPGVDPRLTVVTGLETREEFAGLLSDERLPLMAVRNDRVGDMSDHHAFRLHGHPFLFLSSGEWADYHTPGDTPDKIDYGKVAAVAAQVAGFATVTDGLELGPAQDRDIRGLELSTAVAHLGRDTVQMLGGEPDSIVHALRSRMVMSRFETDDIFRDELWDDGSYVIGDDLD